MTWLTDGLVRLLLVIACIGGSIYLVDAGHLPGDFAGGILTAVLGAVLYGAGSGQSARHTNRAVKEGADAAAKARANP
jgi:hypothetical protein